MLTLQNQDIRKSLSLYIFLYYKKDWRQRYIIFRKSPKPFLDTYLSFNSLQLIVYCAITKHSWFQCRQIKTFCCLSMHFIIMHLTSPISIMQAKKTYQMCKSKHLIPHSLQYCLQDVCLEFASIVVMERKGLNSYSHATTL